MKAQLHYSSVKPIKPVKVWEVRFLAVIAYLLFCLMVLSAAFGKDLLNVFK